MKGAPIRFIAAVVGGWICVRIAVLLPGANGLEIAADALAGPAAATGRETVALSLSRPPIAVMDGAKTVWRSRPVRPEARHFAQNQVRSLMKTIQPRSSENAGRNTVFPILVPATLGPSTTAVLGSRWGASAWFLARGGASGTLTGGRLGASQAGLRVTYLLDRSHRVALAARIATPLRGRGTEAAVGIDWQPTAAPVHLVVEQRIGLDGARGGPTAMAIAGLNPTPVAAGFRLEAYAQGGAILRSGEAEAFGDGAARLARPVAAIGGATLDLGLGAWAAGQRGATRFDVGPMLGVVLPVAGRNLRMSLDWRHRVAGDARPGSGPALSIGADF